MPADFLYDIEVAYGALAQLGERIAGSDEVRGSIPLGSILLKHLTACVGLFFIYFFVLCNSSYKSRSNSGNMPDFVRFIAQNQRLECKSEGFVR